MKTNSLNPVTLKAVIFVWLFLIIRIDAQVPSQCSGSDSNRAPLNSDITVICETSFINLTILLCPIYNANYNETLMILNGQTNESCKGVADFSVTPPVLRFILSLDENSLTACKNVFTIINQVGTNAFSSFSNVQFVNVSGMVVSFDPASGMITYRPSITYIYSCQYPLQYVLNNTLLAVAGVELVINDNNGSFISTLNMYLYSNPEYTLPLLIPGSGLELKEKIYVKVNATGLADSYNVLLDQCFATKEQYEYSTNPASYDRYDLILGCPKDTQTRVEKNGVDQEALFYFEAFRFVMDKNLTVSTFYIHCVTRLCNKSMCPSMLPNCTNSNLRRRRETAQENKATVTSPPIIVGGQNQAPPIQSPETPTTNEYSSPVVAVIVCVAILSLLLVGMAGYFVFNLRDKLRL